MDVDRPPPPIDESNPGLSQSALNRRRMLARIEKIGSVGPRPAMCRRSRLARSGCKGTYCLCFTVDGRWQIEAGPVAVEDQVADRQTTRLVQPEPRAGQKPPQQRPRRSR